MDALIMILHGLLLLAAVSLGDLTSYNQFIYTTVLYH